MATTNKSGYGCIYCATDLPYVHEKYCPRYTPSVKAQKAIEKQPQKPKAKS